VLAFLERLLGAGIFGDHLLKFGVGLQQVGGAPLHLALQVPVVRRHFALQAVQAQMQCDARQQFLGFEGLADEIGAAAGECPYLVESGF